VLAGCYDGYKRTFNRENDVVVDVSDSEVISQSPLCCDYQIKGMCS